MYKSQYYREEAATKSTTITTLAITVAIIFLIIFLLFQGLTKLGGACEGSNIEDNARDCLSRYGYTYSTFKNVGRASDEPSNSMSTVYKFRVTNLSGSSPIKPCYGINAIVKIEVSPNCPINSLVYSITEN